MVRARIPGGSPTRWRGRPARAEGVSQLKRPSCDLIAYGAENTIAVRIDDDLGGGGIHNGPLGMLPLEEDALEEE